MRAGVADHRHHQRARAVLALDVDGEAEVDGAVVGRVRACRRSRRSGRPSPASSVAARAIANAIRCVKETFAPASLSWRAARVERVDRDRAEARRGRDRAALVHVAGEHRRAALDRRRRLGGGIAVAASRTSALTIRPRGPLPATLVEVDRARVGRTPRNGRSLRAASDAAGGPSAASRAAGATSAPGVSSDRRRPRCARSPGRR